MRRVPPVLAFSRLPRGLFTGLMCTLTVAILQALGWLDGAERAGMDQLFQARGARSPDPRITILVADDATVARSAQWPLPRGVYARAIDLLSAAGAHTIACDVLFSVPSYSPREDHQLAEACRKSGHVVQSAAFHVPQIYNPILPTTLTSDRRSLPLRFAIQENSARCLAANWASSALPALQASAAALGHLNVHPELDGTLRKVPHLIRYRDRVYPSLALAATAHYLGVTPGGIVADDLMVTLTPRDGAPRHAPLDPRGEAWINWAGPNDTFPTYNFNQLFDGQIPQVAIKDRLILIGVTAAGAFEYRPTPFSPVQPAVELQANAINDLLSNRPLLQASRGLEILLLLVFSVMVGTLCSPRRAVGATVWLLVLLALLWQFGVVALGHDLYLPLVAPTVGGILTFVLVIAGNYRREWENNWRTDASVAALARGGGLMASGRERDLLLAVIQRTAREVLQARDVFLVIQTQIGSEELPATRGQTGAAELPGLALLPAYGHRMPTLPGAARMVAALGRVVLWNAVQGGGRRETAEGGTATEPDAELRRMLQRVSGEAMAAHQRLHAAPRRAFDTILAAPLLGGADPALEGTSATPEQTPSNGVLIATGRRDGLPFTARDAALLQTLAEQASLALDNLGYYERLRDRVEMANQNLREAYQILADERSNLAEERTKLAAAVESMESALVIADESDRSVFDNGMGTPLLWGETPAPGTLVPEALREAGLAEVAELYGQIRSANGLPLQKVKTETTRWSERSNRGAAERQLLAAQLTPLVAADGRRLGSMLVVTDITAERELEKMKSDFVSFVAHELRTPLTSVNGFATLLRLHAARLPEEKRIEMLLSIEGQCDRLNRLISDLLEIAHMEPGRGIQINRSRFDMAKLGDKVLEQLEVLVADPERMSLNLECPTRPLWVHLDIDRFEQVLVNLVSNAIKYSPEGGRVTLTLRPGITDNERGMLHLEVTDTGMGMTPDQVARLFQKYYRAPDAQARGIKGTGLGLYLVKHLVEAHGGTIEVGSEPGHGTTFTARIPALLSQSAAEVAP